MTRRRTIASVCILSAFLGVGLALAISLSTDVEGIVEDAVAPLGITPNALSSFVLVCSVLAMCATFLVWRCPECRRFPGPITAKFCKHCGEPLYGEFLEPSGRSATVQKDAQTGGTLEKLERHRSLLRRIDRIGKIKKWCQRAVWVLALLPAAFVTYYGAWPLALVIFLLAAFINLVLIQRIFAVIHKVTLLRLKCIHCGKNLADHAERYCSHCGSEVPTLRDEGEEGAA
jgi:hypothetical protein